MPTAVRMKLRHPYDAAHYRRVWGPETYRANRAFYAVNILKQRDPEFGRKFAEIYSQHAVGRLSDRQAHDLVNAEIDSALRRISNPQRAGTA